MLKFSKSAIWNPICILNGHGIASFTHWYNDLANLDRVDWNMVNQQYWSDNLKDLDRQRRKQAEFLIHHFCDWSLIEEIAVINQKIQEQVQTIFGSFPSTMNRTVTIKRQWYY